MYPVIVIIALVALPLLFPAAAMRRLQALQSWLAKRRAGGDHEIAELEALLETHDEWAEQVARLRSATNNQDRALLLAQTLAAGERFLQRVDCRAVPRLCAQTARLCARLRAHRTYRTQHAQHKKGARCLKPDPLRNRRPSALPLGPAARPCAPVV
jgi:hypothetical protein